jgi:hypothetical protein
MFATGTLARLKPQQQNGGLCGPPFLFLIPAFMGTASGQAQLSRNERSLQRF